MPPSQLKQLKASLRDTGVLGPQKSKKQRKAGGRDAKQQIKRNAALEGIREHFNPFEAKAPGRKDKFEIASNKTVKKKIERPGVTRGLGEERRRETLLKEMQSRNKVGGLLDRRFGEDDPNMTPEQKAAERFAKQALRANKKSSAFNLEEDSEEELQLTHGGRALDFADDVVRDDFDEEISASDADEFGAQDDRPPKRVRLESGKEDEEEDTLVERKRSKHEVMQEIIAKSKAYKAARQAAKEDDDDLRMELDKGMGDLFSALQGRTLPSKQLPSPPVTDSEPTLDPSRAAMLAGKSREEAEKEYEANLRQLKLEARSKPSVRTKSEEEKAADEKARLEDLERKRLRRMKGEFDTSSEVSEPEGVELDGEDADLDDAGTFGLEQPHLQTRYMSNLDVEDEDEFVVDDIVATDSEGDAESATEDDQDSDDIEGMLDDGDDDFINGLVLPKPATSNNTRPSTTPNMSKSLPFTFPCPQSCEEVVIALRDVSSEDLPTAVQRIRALYHKGLAQENGEKLANFARSLIPWISDLVNQESRRKTSMQVIEQLIRHLHSMAKAQPLEVAAGFRDYFRDLVNQEETSLNPGDLIVLTSVLTIYPTSDQWHNVVTPAMSILARSLAHSDPSSSYALMAGIFACSLLLQYQNISQRYVPEAINFICRSIRILAPLDKNQRPFLPVVSSLGESVNLRKSSAPKIDPSRKLRFEDLQTAKQCAMDGTISDSLLIATLNNVTSFVDLYSSKSAFPELIAPVRLLLMERVGHTDTLSHINPVTKALMSDLLKKVTSEIEISIKNRKPLLLHNHRPLAIKSSYPAFSDNYNPERRQQDPDRERAELNKLRAEHKKERKGAMRELRKDANFMAREQLREKKAKDEAYERKFKKLVAEIQGEEGREAKEYEKEKAKRKGRF